MDSDTPRLQLEAIGNSKKEVLLPNFMGDSKSYKHRKNVLLRNIFK